MPIPKPKDDEKKTEFIERCMIFHEEDGKYDLKNDEDRKQALAICYSQYKRSLKENKIKTMSEILKG